MDDQPLSRPVGSWTWADMLLTYRFWGLLLAYVCMLASSALVVTWLPFSLQESAPGLQAMWVGLFNLAMIISTLLGFYLAWLATRWQAKRVLLLAATLGLLGGFLLTFEPITSIPLRLVGVFLFGLGVGAITLGIPAILAGGRGGAPAFVIAFGLLVAVTRVVEMPMTVLVGFLWDHFGPGLLTVSVAALGFLALLALLPVEATLFSGAPRARTYQWDVKPRSAVLVGLSSVIGFIYYYLLYKIHGEVVSLRPSAKLLSPWGAVIVLFVPATVSAALGFIIGATAGGTGESAGLLWVVLLVLALPTTLLLSVITTSLVEPLNELAAEQGQPRLIAPWVVLVFSVLFLPVAMALVQRALNQAISMARQADGAGELAG
jgi:MFS family permease